MGSSPHESLVALSSPPTPIFDSPPAGPSSSLLTLSHSPNPCLQSCDPLYLASSLLRVLDERKEEFHCSFGQLMDSLERLKRDTNNREGVIKSKRDNIVMLENLIKMKEKEVENLETLVSTAKTGGRKDHIMPSVMEPNGNRRLPSAPTSLSLRQFFSLSSATSNASSSVSDRRMPTSPVSNVFPSVQSDERKVSGAKGFPAKKIARAGKEVLIADAPGKKTVKDDKEIPGPGGLTVKEVAKVGRRVLIADVTGKKTVKYEKDIPGPGGLPVKKVAEAEKKDSGAGDVPVRKIPKVVASEPREHHMKRLPVSTPFKGRVGLIKTFKGKLHDVVIVKRFCTNQRSL